MLSRRFVGAVGGTGMLAWSLVVPLPAAAAGEPVAANAANAAAGAGAGARAAAPPPDGAPDGPSVRTGPRGVFDIEAIAPGSRGRAAPRGGSGGSGGSSGGAGGFPGGSGGSAGGSGGGGGGSGAAEDPEAAAQRYTDDAMCWAASITPLLPDCPPEAPAGPAPAPGPAPGPGGPGPERVTVTPAQLAQRAMDELRLPEPRVRTAPPRGKRGAVGLREWFWIEPGQWTARKKTVRAGSVWATLTAVPRRTVIYPGTGMGSVTCPGPGTPFDRGRPEAAQSTDCSVLYQRSSAGLPGSAYSVTVSVAWSATWEGSGDAGGTFPETTMSTAFPLRVGEGQALNGG